MQTIPGQRSDVFIFYPQAGAFVGYLVEEYAAGSMGDFLAAINSGQSLLLAFEEVYGKSLYEMENDWRANFEAAPLAIPSVTPEPAEPSEESSPGTPIPLVNFSVGSSGASDSAGDMAATGVTGTTAPVFLPTVTPQNSGNTGTASGGSAAGTGSDSNPNYVIAILVIALLVFAGIWLFIARRSKLPKRKSSG
jgi:cobalamin biosynthesis Mg chelatase CobN